MCGINKKRILVFALCFAGMSLLAGAAVAQNDAIQKASVTPGMEIRIAASGIVEVHQLSDAHLSFVEWTGSGKVQVSGQNVRVKGQARLMVPANVSLFIEMPDGELSLKNISNFVSVRMSHGKLTLFNQIGAIKIAMTEGDLFVVHTQGRGGEINADLKFGRVIFDYKGGTPGGGEVKIRKKGTGLVRLSNSANITLWMRVVKGILKVDPTVGRASENRCYLTSNGGGEGIEILVQSGNGEIQLIDNEDQKASR